MHRLTAAHRTLDFGTVVRVTRRDTQAGVRVRINDRGPFIEGRIIDLSYAAARKIGLDVDGLAPVKVEVVGRSDTVAKAPPIVAHEGAGEGCVWIQVGAFSDLGNARRLEKDLERAGEKAVVMDTLSGLYRVRVGPFAKEREAEKALARVRASWSEAQLVPCG
jgi:rare lipoprotein A